MKWDEPNKQKFAEMWLAGDPAVDIAAHFKITVHVVGTQRARQKLPPRDCRGPKPNTERSNAMLRLREQGMFYKDIGARYGVSRVAAIRGVRQAQKCHES